MPQKFQCIDDFLKSRNKTTLLSFLFLANILFFLFFAWYLPVRFETNDDVIMTLIASGKYTGIPDAHLVWINYVFGLFLSKSYKLIPSIEWYALSFVVIHICSLTVISFTILKNKISKEIKCLFILLLYIVEIRLIIAFQFTTTSAICALAGLILITKSNYKHQVIGLLMFIISFMLRFEAACLVLVVFSPYFLKKKFKGNINYYLRLSIILFAIITISIALKYFDYKSYQQSNTWKLFYSYNDIRGKIHDNPNAYAIFDKLPKGLNTVDYELFLKYIGDAEIISTSRLNDCYKLISHIDFNTLNFKQILTPITSYSHFLIAIFLTLSLILYHIKNQKRNFIIVSSSFILFISILVFISIDGQVKFRVFISALLPFLFILSEFEENNGFESKWVLILFFIILYLVFSKTSSSIRQNYKMEKNQFIEQKHLLDSFLNDTTQMVLPYNDRLAIENINPFEISKEPHIKQIVYSGWMNYYPHNCETFRTHKSFVNGLALFVAQKDTIIVRKIAEQIKVNYKIKVFPNIVKESKNYLIIRYYTIEK